MWRFLSDEHGLTLVELLFSVVFFATAITAAFSIFMVAQSSYHTMMNSEEQTQVLRSALKQIVDETAYANWYLDNQTGKEFSIEVYLPYTDTADPYWTNLTAWKGDWAGNYPFTLRFALESGCLVRDLIGDAGLISRETLACNLSSDSSLIATTDHLLKIKLKAASGQAGGEHDALVYTEVYLR